MLDIKFIRENPQVVKKAVEDKFENIDIDLLLETDQKRRDMQVQIDDLNKQRNDAAKNQDFEKWKALKIEISELEVSYREINEKFVELMQKVPNLPSADTPFGRDDSENVVLRQVGQPRKFDFTPKDHYDLWKSLWIIDNEKAWQITWSRFTHLKWDLVLLQFALINYAISVVTNQEILKQIIVENGLAVSDKPFVPVLPPVFIRPEVMNRMARLEPREERYHTEADDLYLIWSAEHTLGPLHMDEVLQEKELPIRYVGYSTSFRREAGSYGKDVKWILRMHQFDKVEMETFCLPETSIDEQNFLVAIQEYLVKTLWIPYQILMCCTGDMWWPDARHIDLEMWVPSQNKYRETHSADLMTDYQSRRLNTRVKRSTGKMEFVHMNDATTYAMWRTMIAIIENYQQEDGSIAIPEVLKKYVWKDFIR